MRPPFEILLLYKATLVKSQFIIPKKAIERYNINGSVGYTKNSNNSNF